MAIKLKVTQVKSGVGRSAQGGFSVDDGATAQRTASAAPIAATSGIDALLALLSLLNPNCP